MPAVELTETINHKIRDIADHATRLVAGSPLLIRNPCPQYPHN